MRSLCPACPPPSSPLTVGHAVLKAAARRRRHGALALLLASGLAACGAVAGAATAAPEADVAIRAEYRCLGRFDAVDLTAFFFNRSPAELVLLVGETATRLPRLRSADGARYGAAEQTFWVKGEEATWQVRRAPAMRCQPRCP